LNKHNIFESVLYVIESVLYVIESVLYVIESVLYVIESVLHLFTKNYQNYVLVETTACQTWRVI